MKHQTGCAEALVQDAQKKKKTRTHQEMRDKSYLEIKEGMYYWRIIAVLLPVYFCLIHKADVFCLLHSKHFF